MFFFLNNISILQPLPRQHGYLSFRKWPTNRSDFILIAMPSYKVFIKYCVFFRIFENILDSGIRYGQRDVLLQASTGCSLNIVFFPNFLNIPDYGLSLVFLGVSVCTHTRQVEHQHCSGTGRVQKNHKIWKKTQYLMNTLYMIYKFHLL